MCGNYERIDSGFGLFYSGLDIGKDEEAIRNLRHEAECLKNKEAENRESFEIAKGKERIYEEEVDKLCGEIERKIKIAENKTMQIQQLEREIAYCKENSEACKNASEEDTRALAKLKFEIIEQQKILKGIRSQFECDQHFLDKIKQDIEVMHGDIA